MGLHSRLSLLQLACKHGARKQKYCYFIMLFDTKAGVKELFGARMKKTASRTPRGLPLARLSGPYVAILVSLRRVGLLTFRRDKEIQDSV
jgi:hypothetical protein